MHLTNVAIVRINGWLLEEHKSQTFNIVNLVEKEPITKQKKKTIIEEEYQANKEIIVAA